jgi:hypothetical protein
MAILAHKRKVMNRFAFGEVNGEFVESLVLVSVGQTKTTFYSRWREAEGVQVKDYLASPREGIYAGM